MNSNNLTQFLIDYYTEILITLFVVFLLAEMVVPLSRDFRDFRFRWLTNLGMSALNLVMFFLLQPALNLAAAFLAGYLGWGLLNNLDIPFIALIVLGIVILDGKQYLFHWLMHRFDFLWRIHRVHHSDMQIDITSGFRFHPFEALLTSLANIAVILMFGIAPEVVVLTQVFAFFSNLFGHGNIRVPVTVDRWLKYVLVTPSMHHLHHALDVRAANRNYGVIFSFWDRMFRTYLDSHPGSHRPGWEGEPNYRYGIPEYRDNADLNLIGLLLLPFRRNSSSYQLPARTKAD